MALSVMCGDFFEIIRNALYLLINIQLLSANGRHPHFLALPSFPGHISNSTYRTGIDMDVHIESDHVIMASPGKGEGKEGHEALVQKILQIYDSISKLPSLKPCKNVDMLFTELVLTCIPPAPTLDLSKLPADVKSARAKLIRLCAEAEGHLESHYSSLLAAYDNPLDHLQLFPYYGNYLKLSLLEHTILARHQHHVPTRVAFVGSGPMPLTSIVLARHHMRSTTFHNYDIDPAANAMASRLVAADPDLSKRMVFHTTDIMEVGDKLRGYGVVFLAALVGMDKEDKVKVVEHLYRHMAPGAILMLRSAAGARAFLYPVVEEGDLGGGFEVLVEYHPEDEVINSVILARRKVDQGTLVLPCSCCCEVRGTYSHSSVMEELQLEEAS